VALGDN